ncbi:MAG: hypothetical protein PHN38_07255 [Sulfurospirillaceae bacterium]|nr:hypothetical protein [Sulfurospirillaceae bacterium]MDD3462965.1 hypothetical protein [Sulfurospirillaceae bacterium]
MKKTVFISTLMAFGVAVLMSGCSSKVVSCEYKNGYPKGDTKQRAFWLSAKENWRSPSAAYNVKTRNIHLLQNASEVTLHHGLKYFSFVAPNNKVNNKQGSLINTAEGFIEACSPVTDANPLTVFNSPCGYDARSAMADAVIYAYKEQPYDLLSYDAQAVKDYLVSKELWRSDGIEEYQQWCGKK